jgi:hypothetical protein
LPASLCPAELERGIIAVEKKKEQNRKEKEIWPL